MGGAALDLAEAERRPARISSRRTGTISNGRSPRRRRPAVFICDAGPLRGLVPPPPRREAEETLVAVALEALRRGGHALVPACAEVKH